MKRLTWIFFLLIFISLSIVPGFSANDKVMVVPIDSTVEKGLSSFVQRAFIKAESEKVKMVILEINTPGGRIDAARDIERIISNSKLPTTALIKDRAISAGSLIALACDTIAMQPGSTIGDAELYIGSERAGEKQLSDWREKLASTAEAKGRNPEIAAAFADRDIEIPGVTAKGKLLTLTPKKAVELGISDYLVKDRDELLEVLNLEKTLVISTEPTMGENLARFATDPMIAPILLTIGIAGLAIELITVGFGVFGVIGLASMSLFFGGHLLAGFSGWGAIFLFLVGLILLVIEIFVPGFGVFGIGGIASLIGSVVMVSQSLEAALTSLTIAIIGSIVLILVSLKFLTRRNIWKKIVLENKLSNEEGYSASSQELKELLNEEGKALTDLRPSGTAILNNGMRVDVVTYGDYILKDEKVKIIKVEGNRVVVIKI
ncbi:membrane-bound serine protease (ClpP class) [Desulfonispora thiosulfatigenes DSM 11270]|uniref:Membrane-bound serine protease (ClpP class) n=1 Tax=Desulfonispora thiosulfatigenes DSM 11270 TaxID=656914 RepID=A0A1W1VC98_DESTI|nr:nodulation protein NfeD [Desulfonispora thiosulfatigenes]SMB90945.1 membrane-bound serine protease (ClpP class) [Desulfonispora thiosulfatigenes DSM 11270]